MRIGAVISSQTPPIFQTSLFLLDPWLRTVPLVLFDQWDSYQRRVTGISRTNVGVAPKKLYAWLFVLFLFLKRMVVHNSLKSWKPLFLLGKRSELIGLGREGEREGELDWLVMLIRTFSTLQKFARFFLSAAEKIPGCTSCRHIKLKVAQDHKGHYIKVNIMHAYNSWSVRRNSTSSMHWTLRHHRL